MLGHSIKQYRIVRELGGGGFAKVYLAQDDNLQREVAVKILHSNLAQDETIRRFFEREARLIASLEHLAVVPIYDFGDINGQLYLVMRLMRGGTLAERMADSKKKLSLPELIHLLERLTPTLDAMHKKGVIHRDLKPSNILYDEADAAYIADFGIARIQQTVRLTQTGLSFGTLQYSSPEQIIGESTLDHRSDIYTLGIIIYELLTGEYPFWSDTPQGWIYQHLQAPVPQVRQLNRSLPDGVQSVLQRMLAKSREERYDSTQAVLADLKRAQGGQPILFQPTYQELSSTTRRHLSTTPATVQSGTLNRLTIGIASIAIALIILVLGVVFMQNLVDSEEASNTALPTLSPNTGVIALNEATATFTLILTEVATETSPTPIATIGFTATSVPATLPVFVATSTPLPIPSATPSPSPSATETATPTETPIPIIEVPNCRVATGSTFFQFWQANRALIGCPVGPANIIPTIAEEVFEGGHLYWRVDTNDTYAIYDRMKGGGDTTQGYWETDPLWDWAAAGEPDPDGVGLTPPTGRYEPKRGFGWLWRTYLGGETGALGWALDREYGFERVGQAQYFEQGIMFKGSSPKLYILLYDGRFFATSP